jgi:hypothetical protein
VDDGGHALLGLGKILEHRAIEHANSRLCRSMREQRGFQKQLIDPVRRLRRRPPAVVALLAASAAPPATAA